MIAIYSITKSALKRDAQHTILGGGAYREGNWTHATREQCHTDLSSYLGLSKRALLAVLQQQAYKAHLTKWTDPKRGWLRIQRAHKRHNHCGGVGSGASSAMPPTRHPRDVVVHTKESWEMHT